jgi:hypothetical protein
MIIEELYDALIEAGASPDKARAAAKAVADFHQDINDIKSVQRLHSWMLGWIIALGVGIVMLLLNLSIRK